MQEHKVDCGDGEILVRGSDPFVLIQNQSFACVRTPISKEFSILRLDISSKLHREYHKKFVVFPLLASAIFLV